MQDRPLTADFLWSIRWGVDCGELRC